MKCPRCRCDIPHGVINCPECGKPLATFPVSQTAILRQEKSFNPMWLVYGGCGCLFFLIVILFVLIMLGILIMPT